MSFEQAIPIAGVILLIGAWTFSPRGSSLRLLLGVLLITIAVWLYASDDTLLQNVWQAVMGFPQAALDWLQSVRA